MKKDKKLLSEQTVRRFMTLAKIEPLVNPFVSRLNEMCGEEHPELKEEEEQIPPPSMEEPKAPEASVAPEHEASESPAVESHEEMIASLVDALADAIEQSTGVEIEVEKGGEKEEGSEMESPEVPELPEKELGKPGEEEPMMEELQPQKMESVEGEQKDMDLKQGEKGEGKGGHDLKPAEKVSDSLVNEVTKRVLARLLKK